MEYRYLPDHDPLIYQMIRREELRQAKNIELIASENYVSPAVIEAMGSVLNNRYSEGYPNARYYGGQEVMDELETEAIGRAKKLFGAEHANVQPHAGAPANLATYFALAEPGDTILGMDLSHGGHLTHGHPVTHAAKVFRFVRYRMRDHETGVIDYDDMRRVAIEVRPRIILAGFSSYPRELDYSAMRRIADEVGAFAVADMAHIAGLIVGGALQNPFDHGFDVITTTTHKTLRGPRGGLILGRERALGKRIDKSVFPGFQGGPIMQMVAAKAVAFREAATPEFRRYARATVNNAQILAAELMAHGARLITNGTSNHLILINSIASWNTSGQSLQTKLDQIGMTINKNVIPDDNRGPGDPSGIRLGTPAVTTRGMGANEMRAIARIVTEAARAEPGKQLARLSAEVLHLAERFPVPGIERTIQTSSLDPNMAEGARH